MGGENTEVPPPAKQQELPVTTTVETDGDDQIHLPFHAELHTDLYAQAPQDGDGGGVIGGAGSGPADNSAQEGERPAQTAGQTNDRTIVTDRAQATDAPQHQAVDPYEKIGTAQALATELETLLRQNRRPDEVIQVRVNGQMTTMKVSERVAQLKTSMKETVEQATRAADAIRQKGDATNPGIEDMTRQNNADRERLAKALGLDPNGLTLQKLGEEFRRAQNDKPRQDRIKELATVLADRDALARLRFAPMTTRLIEAEFRARGYLDPSIKIGDEVPDSQINMAFDVLSKVKKPGGPEDVALFGQGSKEIADAREVFNTSEKTVNVMLMDQQQKRSLKIVNELQLAAKPGENPETHLKEAVRLADTLKVGYLYNQANITENVQSGLSQELVDIIRFGSSARLKYAEHLVSQGRFHEAQPLMAQVKADSPELIYAKEGDNIVYRQHEGGMTYEALDRAVTLGVTVNPANLEMAQSLLFEQLTSDKLGDKEKGDQFLADVKAGKFKNDEEIFKYLREHGTAAESLKFMKLCREQYKTDIDTGNKVADQQLAALEARKKTFDRQNLTADEQVEKLRIERQMASLTGTRDARQQYLNRVEALTDMTEGFVHMAHGGAKSANGLFASALAKDPNLDKDLAEIKKRSPDTQTLTELVRMTGNTLDGYWQRNNKKFAYAGAAAVGTLTGVGLIGVCGYVGAGVTTTAIVATTGGATLGGLAGLGIERTANPNAGWKEFRDYAKVGGLSAALVVSPWAAQAARAKAGTDAVAISTIGNWASKIGVTRGTLAGSLAMSYSFGAADVIMDGKPIARAFNDSTREGVFNSLLLGISRNWGLANEVGGVQRATMFNRYTVGAGIGFGTVPEIVSVLADGKGYEQARSDAIFNSAMYTLTFGVMAKLGSPQTREAATGLGRLGINRWSVLGGTSLAAAPELKNYYWDRDKPGDQAFVDFLTNAGINTATFAFLSRYGMADHGTGSRVAAPTFRDAAGYGGRAFMMQESWNAAIGVATKQISHDLLRQPYSISRQGPGFIAPLVADYFDYHYGSGLDPNHPGDRQTINNNVTGTTSILQSTIDVNRQNPQPQTGRGLFYDYSRPPAKKDK